LQKLKEVSAVPIYEYKCSQCGETFEAFQRINDQPLTDCRFCRGKVDMLISHSSFQLKGSGWYLSDYARKSQPSHTEVKDATKPGDKASGGDKADSAPSKTGKASE